MGNELGGFHKKVTIVSFLMQLGVVMVHLNTEQYFELHASGAFTDPICEWIYQLCFDGGVVSISFFMVCAAFPDNENAWRKRPVKSRVCGTWTCKLQQIYNNFTTHNEE